MKIRTARSEVAYIDEGKGRPLVLVHPFPLSAEAYRTDADVLADSLRIVAPSMRGFGGSSPFDAVTPPSIDAMADDVAALLDQLDLREPVVVGGISMGGYVALAFARRHADRLAGLVLADTRAEPDSDVARANRDRNIARVEAGEFAPFVDELVPNLVAKRTIDTRPEIVGQVRAIALQQTEAAVAQALAALRDRPDARPGLGSIVVPTLVLVGSEDSVTPVAASEAMVQAIPKATLQVIEGAGHLSNLEAPSAFRDAVRAFVARLPGT
ncbi:alpha/beta hydrolase fold protein [Labilithrix luteola]|uniref:Alpha/beta hydrolase fold protein n=1 Tax=Labilithrix luteola TaxID=1391654 RepID=A0A0K1QAR4_9BACT|nr:alpha/beta hydrolase [Labilithrix luteola]AKV02823.1 alpha/beta hydrolase fold protein [Labilithrix luteola]